MLIGPVDRAEKTLDFTVSLPQEMNQTYYMATDGKKSANGNQECERTTVRRPVTTSYDQLQPSGVRLPISALKLQHPRPHQATATSVNSILRPRDTWILSRKSCIPTAVATYRPLHQTWCADTLLNFSKPLRH